MKTAKRPYYCVAKTKSFNLKRDKIDFIDKSLK